MKQIESKQGLVPLIAEGLELVLLHLQVREQRGLILHQLVLPLQLVLELGQQVS